MNGALAENLARGTSSWMSAAWVILLTAGSLNPTDLIADGERSLSIQIKTCGQASTNAASRITQNDADALLAEQLLNVVRALSEGQKELDPDAKRILYSRMRDLYRR